VQNGLIWRPNVVGDMLSPTADVEVILLRPGIATRGQNGRRLCEQPVRPGAAETSRKHLAGIMGT
jgi:hypothetical protein